MYSETHCHLGDMSLGDIREAEKMVFKLLLTSGIDLPSSEQTITTARRHEIVKSCVGVHPWYADEYNDDVGVRFRELAIVSSTPRSSTMHLTCNLVSRGISRYQQSSMIEPPGRRCLVFSSTPAIPTQDWRSMGSPRT